MTDINVEELRKDFNKPHYLMTTSDDKILFLRAWNPPTKSDVVILIFHGITAYSGPYEMMGEPLAKIGYNVLGLDLRGHGLSDGNRGDYPSKERLLKDLSETIAFVKEKFSTIVLLGHSLGVLTAIIAAYQCPESINGLILLSAGRDVKPGAYKALSFVKKLKILFSSLVSPSKPVITYYRDGVTGLDDPLRQFKYTLRFMSIFNAKKLTFPEKINVPMIFGVGDKDELFTVESAKKLLEEIPCDNKKFIVIKGAKHAEFPPDGFTELISWLDANFK